MISKRVWGSCPRLSYKLSTNIREVSFLAIKDSDLFIRKDLYDNTGRATTLDADKLTSLRSEFNLEYGRRGSDNSAREKYMDYANSPGNFTDSNGNHIHRTGAGLTDNLPNDPRGTLWRFGPLDAFIDDSFTGFEDGESIIKSDAYGKNVDPQSIDKLIDGLSHIVDINKFFGPGDPVYAENQDPEMAEKSGLVYRQTKTITDWVDILSRDTKNVPGTTLRKCNASKDLYKFEYTNVKSDYKYISGNSYTSGNTSVPNRVTHNPTYMTFDGGTSSCQTACTGLCSVICSHACQEQCVYLCDSSCGYSCMGTCGDTCVSACINTCSASCTHWCKGSTGSNITGCSNCASSCSGYTQNQHACVSANGSSCTHQCMTSCSTVCVSGCSTACTGACKSSCSSCTGMCSGSCTGNCNVGCDSTCSVSTGCGFNCSTDCGGDNTGAV
jgi:hypothetical protein